jgi:hypothetical protein
LEVELLPFATYLYMFYLLGWSSSRLETKTPSPLHETGDSLFSRVVGLYGSHLARGSSVLVQVVAGSRRLIPLISSTVGVEEESKQNSREEQEHRGMAAGWMLNGEDRVRSVTEIFDTPCSPGGSFIDQNTRTQPISFRPSDPHIRFLSPFALPCSRQCVRRVVRGNGIKNGGRNRGAGTDNMGL